MNIDFEDGKIIRHADINHWIHECNRYLFLAKVHLKDRSIYPKIDGDPIKYIDNLINLSKIQSEKNSSNMKFLIENVGEESTVVPVIEVINFKFDLPNNEISNLKQTFEKISSNDWENIHLDKIEYAQKLLYKSLKSMEISWESTPI